MILDKVRAVREFGAQRKIEKSDFKNVKGKAESSPEIERINLVKSAPKPILKIHRHPVEINCVPLTERWLSVDQLPTAATNKQTERKSQERKFVTIAQAATSKCDEKFRISGFANCLKTVFLLDTGAHVSLCSKSTALRLGIRQLKKADIAGVIGISDRIVPILGKTAIKLEIAGCEVITDVYVVETQIGGAGSYEMIIGRSTLRQMPLLLDLQSGTLTRKADGKIYAFEIEMETQQKATKSENEMGHEGQKAKTGIEKCLEKHKNVFSTHDYDLGDCKVKAPPILTTSDVPAKTKPYPVPEKYERELKSQIGKMLKAGVITESFTPWAHNVVLVKKSNGQLRPCVDFRPLNKITIPDPYPIPRMDKTILRVAGQTFYSTLDLASGFWQIPLDSESSYKCGIVTPWGLYQMVKLPFGLRNAPSIFQRTMDKALEGIRNVTVYIDDILVHTNTEEEHLETLEKVFCRLNEFGLKLKREKCEFLKNECTYLGHILNGKGYRPSLNNQEVIEGFPEPKNAREVKRFLGMMSFFRKFIQNFAEIANPLQQLTRGKIPEFVWGNREKEAFEKLKNNLLNAQCLRAPNYELPFYLFTDASAIAYAGALMQSQNGNDLYSVGYWSRTLSTTESKLPPTHGELAAIVHAVQNFRPIIYGVDLTILTDHRPLTFLFSKASTNPKLNRWLMALQEFEPKVIYLEGKANRVADALSRVAIKWEQIEGKSREDIPFLLTVDEEIGLHRKTIEKETFEDSILSRVLSQIKASWVEPIDDDELMPYFRERDKLYLDGKIIRKKLGRQIIIPQKMRKRVLKMIHRAHFGIVRCKARARDLVWWPNWYEEVENYVKECHICQRNASNEPRVDPEYKWPEAKYPFERVHADLAGPIWGTNFLIIVDAYSKYPFVCQMNSTHSSAIVNYLREVFAFFGSPQCLVTDNGPQFVSSETEQFLENEGVRHLKTPIYHPSSNGQAERFVRTFKEIMGKLLEEGMSLKVAQFVFLQEYRVTPCSATEGESPALRFLGRGIRTALDKIKMPPNLPEANGNGPSGEVTELEGPSRAQIKDKNLDPGDNVWVKEPSGKWAPGVLLQPKGERMWEVMLEGNTVTRTAHLDQLKSRRIGQSRHI